MKNNKIFVIILAVFGVAALISSCEKDKVNPPDTPVIVGMAYNIRELKELSLPHVFDTAASLYVTIAMDESTGNIYKELYVQDSTGGMRLTFKDPTGLKTGDSILIRLEGNRMRDSLGTYELVNIDARKDIVLLASGRYIKPKEATLMQINSGMFDFQLVKVIDVQFDAGDTAATWADKLTATTTNRTLEDCRKNDIIVRTSGYATFAGEKLPQGKGSLVAVVGIFRTTKQLWTRSMTEVDMKGLRCEESEGDFETIFSETFAAGQGDFSIYSVLGAQEWTHNAAYTCMAMSGFASGSNHENEDWLISPNIDFSNVTEAELSFSHTISKGGGNTVTQEYMKTNQTIWISSNYTEGTPSNAHWTRIDYEGFPSGTNWTYVNAFASIPTEFLGKQNIRIAFKYTCDNTDSATWQVRDVLVQGVQ
jgi:hypothetical protein